MRVKTVLVDSQRLQGRAKNVPALLIDAGAQTPDRSQDDVTGLRERFVIDKFGREKPWFLFALPRFTDIGRHPDRPTLLAVLIRLEARSPYQFREPEINEVANPTTMWRIGRRTQCHTRRSRWQIPPGIRELLLRVLDLDDHRAEINEPWLIEPLAGHQRCITAEKIEHRDGCSESSLWREPLRLGTPGPHRFNEFAPHVFAQVLAVHIDHQHRLRVAQRRSNDPKRRRNAGPCQRSTWEGNDRF